jgi:two-component system, OmpR family, alkaline phosphatase synthesis response regulator PhoP
MTGRKVLVVDDEARLVEVLKAYLERDGYAVVTAADGRDALLKARRERPDLILLDLMLPEVDGIEVCRTVRKESDVPIIMLTARAEETDKLIGLELGADDYITKPFSPREVIARVRAVLRRTQSARESGDEVLSIGDLVIDRGRHDIRRNDVVVDLTPTEFALLWTLVSNRGRVLSRLQLMEKALGESYEGYERTIDAHIKNLRRKVETDPAHPRYVQTVFGVGYKCEGT